MCMVKLLTRIWKSAMLLKKYFGDMPRPRDFGCCFHLLFLRCSEGRYSSCCSCPGTHMRSRHLLEKWNEFLFVEFFLWYWDPSNISPAGQMVYSRATHPALLLEKWVPELERRGSWWWRTRKEFCTILKISLYQFAIVIKLKDQFTKPFGTEWNLPPNNEAELITMSLQWF